MTEQRRSKMAVEYKPIGGFPGYRVGNDGSVWTCWSVGSSAPRLTDSWKRMKLRIADKGRPQVGLTRDGRQTKHHVCCLVLTAFVGPRPPGMQACHFPDRNPENNNLNNLRWDTPKANQADRIVHGTDIRGEAQGLSKLTEATVRLLRADVAAGMSQRKAARKYRVGQSTDYQVVNQLTWRHVV
jgi:hypothetical protein